MLIAGNGLARVLMDGARRIVHENGTLRSGDSIGLFGMPRLNAKALCDVVAVRTILLAGTLDLGLVPYPILSPFIGS